MCFIDYFLFLLDMLRSSVTQKMSHAIQYGGEIGECGRPCPCCSLSDRLQRNWGNSQNSMGKLLQLSLVDASKIMPLWNTLLLNNNMQTKPPVS